MLLHCAALIVVTLTSILASYVDEQNSAICDILSATNIQNLKGNSTEWNCTSGNVPVVNPCSVGKIWSFLDCINNSTVVAMNLTDRGLVGTLPSSIGLLTSLLELVVADNNITGELPTEFGMLNMLTSLVVEDTSISGTIPSHLADISGLQHLVLDSNSFEGSLSSEFCGMASLSTLSVNNNPGITCFDSCITGLSGTVDVSLSQAEYTLLSCASVIHWLPVCEIMSSTGWGVDEQESGSDAWKCHSGVPYSNPCNDWALTSNGAFITPIVCDSGDSERITYLNLVQVTSGTLPSTIGSLSALTKLKVSLSSFSGSIPAEIGSLTMLSALFISGGSMTGTIPDAVGSLTKLTSLTLSYNTLSGELPETLGSLHQLETLSVTGNSLSGSVPSSLCGVTGLTSLDVTGNGGMTCYSACLTSVEVFPRDYTIAPADEDSRQFESCDSSNVSTEGLLFGVGYATVFLIGGLVVGCGMCIRSALLQPEDTSYADDVAAMRRDERVTVCCRCLFHNPCCDCHTHHHDHRRVTRRKHDSLEEGYTSPSSGVVAGRAEIVVQSARGRRMLANERSKVIPISRSHSNESESVNSPIRVVSSRLDL